MNKKIHISLLIIFLVAISALGFFLYQSKVKVKREIEKVKEECLKLFPDKLYLYRMIYESRFKRLHNQFRKQ
jgi:hypothetical protein